MSVILTGVHSAPPDLASQPGLWVGTITINEVSVPTSKTPQTPQPTATSFTVRLILHVDKGGKVQFLQHVNILSDSSLATDKYVKDPNLVKGRITSVGFSFSDPISMTLDPNTKTYQCTIKLGFDDPLNPFKHKYHPDHDNLNVLSAGVESWGIQRKISLQLSSNGSGVVKGTYSETLSGNSGKQGLYNKELYVKGAFTLSLIQPNSTLNASL